MALLKETTVTTSQNGYSLILRTYEDAVNKAANTSTVRIELLLKSNSVRFVDYGCLGELWLNGALAYSNEAQYSFPSLGSTITIASWTTSVEHNSDGARSITVSAWFKCASGAYTAGSAEVTNGSMALTPIARTPSAPTAVTAKAGGDGAYYPGGTVNIAWSGAAGTITGYEVQYALRAAGSGTWGAWTALKTATGTSTTDTRSMMFGQAVKYRVRAKNGSLASGWKESNALTRTGGVYLRVNGAWKPGTVYRRVNGSWKQAADVYRRIGGTWRRSVP